MSGPEPVTVVVSERVKPGREEDYRRWQDGLTAAARTFEGFQATEVLPPRPGVQDEWVVVFRFESPAHLEAWLGSDVRRGWMKSGEPLFDAVRMQRLSGFAGWFAAGGPTAGEAGAAPPDWKQAMAVMLGLYPTVMVLTLLLSPLMNSWPLALNIFVGNVVSVALLTWLVMPVVNRILGGWLAPTGPTWWSRPVLAVAAIVAAYAGLLALFLVIPS